MGVVLFIVDRDLCEWTHYQVLWRQIEGIATIISSVNLCDSICNPCCQLYCLLAILACISYHPYINFWLIWLTWVKIIIWLAHCPLWQTLIDIWCVALLIRSPLSATIQFLLLNAQHFHPVAWCFTTEIGTARIGKPLNVGAKTEYLYVRYIHGILHRYKMKGHKCAWLCVLVQHIRDVLIRKYAFFRVVSIVNFRFTQRAAMCHLYVVMSVCVCVCVCVACIVFMHHLM